MDPALSGLEFGADMLNSLMMGEHQEAPSIQGSNRLQQVWNADMQSENTLENEQDEQESFLDRQLKSRFTESRADLNTVHSYEKRQAERQQQAQELIVQLRTISNQAGEQAAQSQITAVQGIQGKAGEYHITFLETIVRSAALMRQRAQESNTWIAQSAQRRGDKKNYWNMFHKHGSQWFQSGERAIVTSVG